mmetsp:Transcript_23918/g.52292  ORF Transcript_23918/g.52292 Transcript_23918/m.52292 type:complete len:285 (+) Transcript_23918:385-1239(+)
MLRIGTAAGDGQDLANDACEKRPLPPPRAAFRNPSAGRAVCVVSISFHGCHSRHGGVRFGENEDHERVVRLKPLLLGAPVELDTDWGRGVVARRAEGEGDLADESVRLVDRDERVAKPRVQSSHGASQPAAGEAAGGNAPNTRAYGVAFVWLPRARRVDPLHRAIVLALGDLVTQSIGEGAHIALVWDAVVGLLVAGPIRLHYNRLVANRWVALAQFAVVAVAKVCVSTRRFYATCAHSVCDIADAVLRMCFANPKAVAHATQAEPMALSVKEYCRTRTMRSRC